MPSCSGTTRFINPITSGIATKKIMMVPCAEKVTVEQQHRERRGEDRKDCDNHIRFDASAVQQKTGMRSTLAATR